MAFDLSTVPTNAQIESVELTLFVKDVEQVLPQSQSLSL